MTDTLTPEDTKAAEQAAMDAVQVGDIFTASWGYDQTNVDYYLVVARTKASVRVRQVATSTVASLGSGHDRVMPAADQFVGDEMLKRLKAWSFGGKVTVSIYLETYCSGYLWDGKDQYQTASGWGH